MPNLDIAESKNLPLFEIKQNCLKILISILKEYAIRDK